MRHLTISKYNEWISRHKEGDKPWIIAFGSTVYSNPLSTQTTNLMMNKLSCLAELVGDQANFGFIDYSQGEKILESLDYTKSSYGHMAPLLIYVKDGIVYHL